VGNLSADPPHAKLAVVVRHRRLPAKRFWTRFVGLVALLVLGAGAAAADAASPACTPELSGRIPDRPAAAASGSAFVKRVMDASGEARDKAASAEILSGNIPSFLRRLIPVRLSGKLPDGRSARVVICVMPDYLAVGSDRDFVRVPMGLPSAAGLADRLGFLLPTTAMVDAIHRQAAIRLKPRPMKPTSRMRSTAYLWRHDQTVDRQRGAVAGTLDLLTAGQKKDLVLSNRLRSVRGRVAIYGWHRRNGTPIQPLSTVHGARYADYSHGVRLVSATAFVNGAARSLARLLNDPGFARILSREGPIADAAGLLASLHKR